MEVLSAVRKLKRLLLVMAIVHIVFFTIGYYTVPLGFYSTLEREKLVGNIMVQEPLKSVGQAVVFGDISTAILLTFFTNLGIGAFLTTTLTGIFFPIPILVSTYRCWLIGLLYYGIFKNLQLTVVAVGTLIFELGGYVLSSAAGVNIGLSLLFPSRYKLINRFKAFNEAWKDAGRVYPLIFVLLAVSAVWEILGISLLI